MRKVEVSAKQVADLARRLAQGFCYSDPDLVPSPFTGGMACYAVARSGSEFPVWRLFEGAAREMLAEVGKLADIEFVIVSDQPVAG